MPHALKSAPDIRAVSPGLPPPFVHFVATWLPRTEPGRGSIVHHHEAEYSATLEVLAPVWVMLSRSIITYSTSCAPLAGTSPLHRKAAYKRCLRCAGAPRRPARSGRTMARCGLRMMPPVGIEIERAPL